jgi:hypothetical protein
MPDLRTLPNVETTGAYLESDLPDILARSQCHLAFFPSVCPETYSFTLSQAFYAGLYPVAFDIGAVARRIRASGWGHVLPAEMMWLPAKVNEPFWGWILLSRQLAGTRFPEVNFIRTFFATTMTSSLPARQSGCERPAGSQNKSWCMANRRGVSPDEARPVGRFGGAAGQGRERELS